MMEYEDIPEPYKSDYWERAMSLLESGYPLSDFTLASGIDSFIEKRERAKEMAVKMYQAKHQDEE